jgi:hypothetical protein
VCAWAAAWVDGGSILRSAWMQYGLVASLVVAVVLAAGAAVPLDRAQLLGVAALGGLGCWAIATLAWAPEPAQARDEGMLAILYAAVLLVPWLTLRTADDRLVATALVVAGSAALAVATGFALTRADPLEVYYSGRLNYPISYQNAQAACFLVAFWPAVTLAARATLHPIARGLACGAGAALLAGWIATQSKGGALGLACSAILLFGIVRGRLRLLVPTLVVAGCAGAFWSPLVAPYPLSGAALAMAVHRVGWSIVAAGGAALAAGLLYALADRRVETGARARRAAGAAAAGALIGAVAAALAAFVVLVPHPGRFAHDRWYSFTHAEARDTASTHFATLGSARYDFWRVAVHELERHPLAGIGARGFREAYLREGRSIETPRRAHSLELDVLSEEGVFGFALLALALGVPLALCARLAFRPSSAAALAAATFFLVQASVDWTWTFPAVGIPFFLLLAIGSSAGGAAGLSRWQAWPAAALALTVAIVGFLPPWLAGRLADHDSHLGLARRLDPLAPEPWIARYEATGSAGALAHAVALEPRAADLRFALGLAYLQQGARAAALAQLAEAHRLYPRNRVIESALQRARYALPT